MMPSTNPVGPPADPAVPEGDASVISADDAYETPRTRHRVKLFKLG